MVPDRRISRRNILSAGGLGLTAAFAGCASVLGNTGNTVIQDWSTSVPITTGGVTHHSGTAYVCAEHKLQTVDADTGNKGWKFSTGQTETSSRPVIADDTVIFGTLSFRNQATLYAVTTDGEEEWKATLPGGVTTSTVSDGSVFTASGVMGGDAGLYAFDLETGDSEWDISLEDHPVGSSPTITDGTVYIESGGFAAFDAETGDLNWRNERDRTEIGEAARFSPTVGDETVYFSHSLKPEVYAFDTGTGKQKWMTETNARASKPVLTNSTLYVGTTSPSPADPKGKLYALDATTGDEQWSVTTGDVPLNGPIVDDGTVYTAGHTTLYAIDSASGEIGWKYEFDNGISAPVLSDETLIIDTPHSGSSAHTLHALSW